MQTSDAGAKPRFRQDLVAEPVEEQGARFIDVMDPDNGAVFRFYEVEYALACAMDGERDVAGIVKWAQEELGLTPSATEVQTVISTLADLRFVQTDREDAKVSKAAATTPEAPQPAAQARPADRELAKGVVVGRAGAPAKGRASDLELGGAGSQPSAAPAQAAEPAGGDFELGAPGAAPRKAPPRPPVEDIGLGAPGAASVEAATKAAVTKAAVKPPADVSIELKDHLAIKPDDVKEAVRASKVISSVDMPKELQDAIDPVVSKQPEKAPAKQPEKAATKGAKQAPDKVAAKAGDKKPADKVAAKAGDKKPADKQADKPARELPRQPSADKIPVAPPAPHAGPNVVLVILLILVAVGAGMFAVWKFVLNKPEPEVTSQKVPPPPPPPPKPVTLTAKVVLETPPAVEVKAPAAGAIETIEANDTEVQAGDVVARLVGGKPLAAEVAKLLAELARLQPALEAAEQALDTAQQTENNEAGVARAQAAYDKAKKAVDEKQVVLDKRQGEIDVLALKAAADGKLAGVVAVGAQVTADQVVAQVIAPTAPTATFKIPPSTKLAQDGTLSIAAGGQTVVCTISDAQAETVKITCPADSGLTDGADVTFTLPR